MKKTMLTVSMILGLALASTPAMAAGSIEHFSQAAEYSGQAVGNSAAGSVQLTSAAVAVPLVIVGAVGHVSGQVGHDLLKAAKGDIGKPLPVSDETVTAGPNPAQAMNRDRQIRR